MNKQLIAIIVLAVALIAISAYSYNKMSATEDDMQFIMEELIDNGGTWQCIMYVCLDWAEGEDWVAKHCKVNPEQNDLNCKFSIEGVAQDVPLSKLNYTNFRSCTRPGCATEVFVRKYNLEVTK